MDDFGTLSLHRGGRDFLVARARLSQGDGHDRALAEAPLLGGAAVRVNPDVLWVTGNFVEGDNPNSNGQFWTAGDLEMAEYTIRYAPMNMLHKWREPVGFFLNTEIVPLVRADGAMAGGGSMKIVALGGMWSHIFPGEAEQVRRADEAGMLAYSMECVGSHLRCAGASGCGQTFGYADVSSHCNHLRDRTSIRHIVNPVFRGGALIVPPTRPGWKGATAKVVTSDLLAQAELYAERYEENYRSVASSMTPRQWETLMAMVLGGA